MSRRLLPAVTATLLIVTLLPVGAGPVAAAGPAAPVLLEPGPGAEVGDTGVHFRWSRVAGAVSYRLHVWSDVEGEGYDLVEVTANDDLVAYVSIATALLNWSVTSIDAQGNDGQTAVSTFAPADPAPALLGPADDSVVTYPDAGVQFRAWSRDAPPYSYYYDDATEAGQGGPLPALGGTSAEPRLEPGTYRWTAGSPGQDHRQPAVAPVRRLSVEWRDSTPQLLEPADGATIAAGGTAVLRWDPVPGAVAYEVQFDRGPGFDGQPVTGTPTTAYVLSDLWTAQTLRWRVRPTQTRTGDLWPVRGPWSEARTIAVSPPGEITGLSPADGATVASWPVFRWDPLPNAGAYEVAFAVDPAAGPTQSRVVNAPAFGLTASSDWLAQIEAGATWWRVRAVERLSAGLQSEWSDWRHVTVQEPGGTLGAPVAAAGTGAAACPEGETCDGLTGWPILRWEPVAGARVYRVFQKEPTMADFGHVDVPGAAFVAGPLASLSSDPGTARLEWSVVACPSAASCPAEPAGPVYHVSRALPAPAPVSPADDAIVDHAGQVLTWLPLASDLASGPDEVMPALTTCLETTRTRDGGSSTTSTRCVLATSAIVDLTDGADVVEWRVRADAGPTFTAEPGAWSTVRSFRHQTPTPVLDAPVESAVVSGAPVLRWHTSPSEVEYGVEVVREDVYDAWGWSLAMRYAPGGATSVQTTTPLAPGAYRWRVTTGPDVAAVGHFTVAGSAELPLLAPSAGADVPADDVDLAWTEVPWARFYTVAIGATPDFWGIDAVWWGTSPLPSMAVPVRLPEGPLYWRVCPMIDGLNASDCSVASPLGAGASEVRAMTVTSALSTRDLASPTSGGLRVQPRIDATVSTTGRVPVRLRWTSSDVGSGVDAQEIQVSRDGGPWQAATLAPLPGGASSLDASLLAGHRYQWRVRATDLAGNIGDWTTVQAGLRLRQETASAWRWSGGWSRVRSAVASGGAFRRSTEPGATARMTVTATSIALIAPRSSHRGKAEVWIDGRKVATIRLDAAPTGARRVVFTKSWSSVGSHRIRIVVLGAPAGTRVDLDAVVLVE